MAKTAEQVLAEAKTAGVEVAVTECPTEMGEVTLLPDLRPPR